MYYDNVKGGIDMAQSFNKNRFDMIIKVVHKFLRFAIIGTAILISIIALGGFVVLFIPKDILDFNLGNIEHINVQVMNVLYSINDDILSGVINVKWLIVFGSFTGVINLVFVYYIFRKLKQVIGDVLEEVPFSENNIIRLKHLGFAYVISSVVLPMLNAGFMVYVVNLLNLFEANVNFQISLQALFMGALILILATVFEYGKYLQEDHDLTV
jgi:hypothetical protein